MNGIHESYVIGRGSAQALQAVRFWGEAEQMRDHIARMAGVTNARVVELASGQFQVQYEFSRA